MRSALLEGWNSVSTRLQFVRRRCQRDCACPLFTLFGPHPHRDEISTRGGLDLVAPSPTNTGKHNPNTAERNRPPLTLIVGHRNLDDRVVFFPLHLFVPFITSHLTPCSSPRNEVENEVRASYAPRVRETTTLGRSESASLTRKREGRRNACEQRTGSSRTGQRSPSPPCPSAVVRNAPCTASTARLYERSDAKSRRRRVADGGRGST
jgi:hypothetical protein